MPSRDRPFLNCALTVALLAAAGTVPAERLTAQVRAISESDRRLGAQEHPKILEQFGGTYSGPGVALVTRVGKDIAVRSGLATTGAECTVTLLNSRVVNAFAIPGCYVYVTRGLLAIMNDEAELASVLGHEIGHVAARHGQKRQRAATIGGLGTLLAGVFLGDVAAKLTNVLAQGTVLKFSRSQENEADALGIRYMTAAGYDPFASPDMLKSLGDESALEVKVRGRDEAAQAPAWARSHPLTSDRVATTTALAKKTGLAPGTRARNADRYFAAVDGLLYGDDPSQGFAEDSVFSHPGLKLRFQAPAGFYLDNGSDAVTIEGPGGLRARFAGGTLGADGLDGYAQRVLRETLGDSGNFSLGQTGRTSINGLDALVQPVRAATQSGVVDVQVIAYRFSADQAYSFVTIAPSGRSGVFDPLVGSFRRISDSEVAQLRPRVVNVVKVRAGDTAASLAGRMAYSSLRLERFLVLNDRRADQPLKVGEPVKIVTYAAPAGRN